MLTNPPETADIYESYSRFGVRQEIEKNFRQCRYLERQTISCTIGTEVLRLP